MQQLTDGLKVLYVHAAVEVDDSTEDVERKREGGGCVFIWILQLLPVIYGATCICHYLSVADCVLQIDSHALP